MLLPTNPPIPPPKFQIYTTSLKNEKACKYHRSLFRRIADKKKNPLALVSQAGESQAFPGLLRANNRVHSCPGPWGQVPPSSPAVASLPLTSLLTGQRNGALRISGNWLAFGQPSRERFLDRATTTDLLDQINFYCRGLFCAPIRCL